MINLSPSPFPHVKQHLLSIEVQVYFLNSPYHEQVSRNIHKISKICRSRRDVARHRKKRLNFTVHEMHARGTSKTPPYCVYTSLCSIKFVCSSKFPTIEIFYLLNVKIHLHVAEFAQLEEAFYWFLLNRPHSKWTITTIFTMKEMEYLRRIETIQEACTCLSISLVFAPLPTQ